MQLEQAIRKPDSGSAPETATMPVTVKGRNNSHAMTRRASNLPSFFASDMRMALVIALVWQAALTVIAKFLMPDHTTILGQMQLWDSKDYLEIIKHHYTLNPALPAFYPMFPLVVGIIWMATFHLMHPLLIGLLVNTACLWLAIGALLVIAEHFAPGKYRHLSAVFFLVAPAAFFMHLFYSEALFIALGFWAYAFALRRSWLFVGLALGVLTATRLPSELFVGMCGLEYLRSYRWNVKQAFNPKLGYFLLAPIGFLAYATYLLVVRGDFFAMFSAYHATKEWSFHTFEPNFLYTIARAVRDTVHAFVGERPLDNDIIVNYAVPLLCIGLLLASSLYLILRCRSKGIPLGVFGIVSIVHFTLINSLVAVHRYILPCLTIYIALMVLYAYHPRLRVTVITAGLTMVSVQGYLVWLCFGAGGFVG